MIARQQHPKLIFVVGVWRSGTSLLHAMLNNHPQIALLYEAEPLALFPRREQTIWPADWAERLELFNQTFSRHRLEATARESGQTARESMLKLFQTWATRKGATVMGGKSPSYHQYLPKIAQIFPEAEFVIIWRDPLEVCRSVVNAGKKNRFFSRKGILTRVFFGSQQLAEGVAQLRADGRRVHEMVYSELISEPEQELRKACDFLGLEFDARMLDLKSADCSMLPDGEHHTLVRSGVVKPKSGIRPEVLSARFVAKGIRYGALWRQNYAHLAFSRALPEVPTVRLPGNFEKLKDWVIYHGWLLLTELKHLIFRLMPLWIWQRLRSEPEMKIIKKAA